jgi:hypothetical protein
MTIFCLQLDPIAHVSIIASAAVILCFALSNKSKTAPKKRRGQTKLQQDQTG